MSTATDVTKDKLVADLKMVISDAEELLLATAAQAGEKASAARATDDYVHENPWAAVGIGAALGLVVGMLISRR